MTRRRKSGKSGVFFVILALIAWIGWNMFMSSSQQNASQSPPPLAQEPSPPPGMPWPYLEEDKQTQVASNLLATNIYIVFDASGSMGDGGCSGGEAKIRVAKRAVEEFAKSIPQDTNVGMVVFDRTGTHERVALSPINSAALSSTVNAINYGGGTPLTDAMQVGFKALTQQGKKQLGYGEYHLLVVTDGQANNSQALNQEVDKILKYSPVLIHTIGFCIDENHSLHQPGKTNYSTAKDYESLLQGMRSVLAEAPSFSVSEFNKE